VAAALSRVAQDFNLWSMAEFGIAWVGDSFAATSSMMPQKRNAVCWEFIRARTAKVIGAAAEVVGIVHNTFLADVCDTCIELAEPTWRALETAVGTIRLLGDAILSVRFEEEKMLSMVERGFSTVSELAELIQQKSGQPYRIVHRLVGQVVNHMLAAGKTAADIDAAAVRQTMTDLDFPAVPLTEAEIKRVLDPRHFIDMHSSLGGTAPAEGQRMLAERQTHLQQMRAEQHQRYAKLTDAKDRLETRIDDIVNTEAPDG
jgi:argininosuccinate lyase